MWRFVMPPPPPPHKKQKLDGTTTKKNRKVITIVYTRSTSFHPMFCGMCIKHDVTSKLDFICYRLSSHEITLYQGISIITNM